VQTPQRSGAGSLNGLQIGPVTCKKSVPDQESPFTSAAS